MGSFNLSCSVSGLPLTPGDPVIAFLLTHSPYTDDGLGLQGQWVVRTPILRGEYDDYGRIRSKDEVMKRCWAAALNLDLVPRGVGDNRCHDVAVQKGMTWEQCMKAIHENRLQVMRNYGETPDRHPPEQPPEIPTLDRVEAALVECFGEKAKDFLVDELARYHLRVRWADYGKVPLEKLAKFRFHVTPRWAAMIVTIRNNTELWIAPPAHLEGNHSTSGLQAKEAPLDVKLCLIREDVWKSLLALKISGITRAKLSTKIKGDGDNDGTGSALRETLKLLREAGNPADPSAASLPKTEAEIALEKLLEPLERLADEINMRRYNVGECIPYMLTVGAHCGLLQKDGRWSAEIESDVLDFQYVALMLGCMSYQLRPTSGALQSPAYGAHAAFLVRLAKIAAGLDRANLMERKKYEHE